MARIISCASGVLILLLVLNIEHYKAEEPRCGSNFDCNYEILQKLFQLEQKIQDLKMENEKQQKLIDRMSTKGKWCLFFKVITMFIRDVGFKSCSKCNNYDDLSARLVDKDINSHIGIRFESLIYIPSGNRVFLQIKIV